MSDNFTPLPPVASKSSKWKLVSAKKTIGGIMTFGLLAAIGGGMFFINRPQTTGTKAYSTTECAQQGGFEWAGSEGSTPICPGDGKNVGTISSSDQGSGDGQLGGSLGGSTGGNHICCVPKTGEQTPVTPLQTQNTPIPQDTPVPGEPSKTPDNPSCRLPQPQINITCPNGCITQTQ